MKHVFASALVALLVSVGASSATSSSDVDRCLQTGVPVSAYHSAHGGSMVLAPTRKPQDPHLFVAVWSRNCEVPLTYRELGWRH